MEENHVVIEDWAIDFVKYDENLFLPNLKGNVSGKIVRGELYWLDLDDEIAMTDKEIYKLGTPNQQWHANLISNGQSLKDMEIKGTSH